MDFILKIIFKVVENIEKILALSIEMVSKREKLKV